MENNIVKDFQNLHVLNTYNFERMDELVQDLTNALEETTRKSKNVDSTYARRCKKRRSRKRRPPGTGKDGGNLSEASESSIDEALKDYMENVFQQSDSDDVVAARRLSSLPLANLSHALSLAESDSVTENFSPMRIHRRRRKCKRMAIDPQPDPDFMIPTLKPKFKRMRSKNVKTLEARTDNVMDTEQNAQCSDSCTNDVEGHHGECSTTEANKNATCNAQQESSSSISSSESDGGVAGIFTNDEGRDGDDEQSDFFHEAGPACGIPGIIPWWENEKHEDESTSSYDPNFQKILTGSFDFMSQSSQRSFKTRVSKLLARREIRAARRRLKARRTGYPFTRLQQQCADSQNGDEAMFNYWATSPAIQNDIKRRRKTPPSTPTKEGYVGADADPIPVENKGQQMLRNMGWTPGTGLGSRQSGITSPVIAYIRPKRKGLGSDMGPNS